MKGIWGLKWEKMELRKKTKSVRWGIWVKKRECDVCLRTDDKAWRWRERDCGRGKTKFLPFYGFPWFICGNLVCVYVGEGNLFLYLDFFSRVWVFLFFSLNQKPALYMCCGTWLDLHFARYLWDILREFRFGHLRMASGWWPVYYTKIFNVIWIFFFWFKYRIW